MASGLEYLHSNYIVHGDLRGVKYTTFILIRRSHYIVY